jgi:hypothetical protein
MLLSERDFLVHRQKHKWLLAEAEERRLVHDAMQQSGRLIIRVLVIGWMENAQHGLHHLLRRPHRHCPAPAPDLSRRLIRS